MSLQDEQNQQYYEALVNLQKLATAMYAQAHTMETQNGVPCQRVRSRLSKAREYIDEAVYVFNMDVIRGAKTPTKAQLDMQLEQELS
jgi:hypothetical protein